MDFTEPYSTAEGGRGKVLVVERQEIDQLLEKVDGRKAMGADGVSSWTLKECREQLVEAIWNVIN